MKRFFRLAVLLTALSACAARPPQLSTSQADIPRVQVVAPAGYCVSDETDPLGMNLKQSLSAPRPQDYQILAMFRPCDEPMFKPGTEARRIDRLAFYALPRPSTTRIINRSDYLGVLSKPKVLEYWKRYLSSAAEDQKTSDDNPSHRIQYLGSDENAAYLEMNGTAIDLVQSRYAGFRVVLGQTMINQAIIRVDAASFGIGRSPKEWPALREIVRQAIRSTIAASEQPAPEISKPAPAAKSPSQLAPAE